VKSQKCPYHVTYDLDLDLEHNWMQAGLGTIMCKFDGDPAIYLRKEVISVKSQKCPYHMTFDLKLDLKHILDAGPSGDNRV